MYRPDFALSGMSSQEITRRGDERERQKIDHSFIISFIRTTVRRSTVIALSVCLYVTSYFFKFSAHFGNRANTG